MGLSLAASFDSPDTDTDQEIFKNDFSIKVKNCVFYHLCYYDQDQDDYWKRKSSSISPDHILPFHNYYVLPFHNYISIAPLKLLK
jgi:hypothetical protein